MTSLPEVAMIDGKVMVAIQRGNGDSAMAEMSPEVARGIGVLLIQTAYRAELAEVMQTKVSGAPSPHPREDSARPKAYHVTFIPPRGPSQGKEISRIFFGTDEEDVIHNVHKAFDKDKQKVKVINVEQEVA